METRSEAITLTFLCKFIQIVFDVLEVYSFKIKSVKEGREREREMERDRERGETVAKKPSSK